MTQNPDILTDEEIKNLSHGFSTARWVMEAQSSRPVEADILTRAIATIRELKKDLKLADFLSDKLEEKIAGLEKENERLNNIIRALMNPRMKHGTLQGPLREE